MGSDGSLQAAFKTATRPELKRLAKEEPGAGIVFQKAFIHTRNKDLGKSVLFGTTDGSLPWWSTLFDDFKVVHNTAPGIHTSYEFTTVCINTVIYLQWLRIRLHSSGSADVVINCTGLMARTLGGVEDTTVLPARGQTILVRNDPGIMTTVSSLTVTSSNQSAVDGEMAYMMCRSGGGGTILGGCYQIGNWNPHPDPDLTESIKRNCVALYAALTGGKGVEGLSVIRYGVGFRPLRPQGARVEAERIQEVPVVHNYGHGGWGYQASYGCSLRVVGLVNEQLGTAKAKL